MTITLGVLFAVLLFTLAQFICVGLLFRALRRSRDAVALSINAFDVQLKELRAAALTTHTRLLSQDDWRARESERDQAQRDAENRVGNLLAGLESRLRQQGVNTAHWLEENAKAFAEKLGEIVAAQEFARAHVTDELQAFNRASSTTHAQLRLATEQLRADVAAMHGSVASLDFGGIKGGVASLQVAIQGQVAKLHADLAAVENGLAGLTLSEVKTQVEALTKRQDEDDARRAAAASEERQLREIIQSALEKHATAPNADSRPGHHTQRVRRAFVERELSERGITSIPIDLDEQIRKLAL